MISIVLYIIGCVCPPVSALGALGMIGAMASIFSASTNLINGADNS